MEIITSCFDYKNKYFFFILAFMLLWREEIKTKKEILIICFMFYFYWLNNKGKMVKLSIYNKCNFF